MATRDYQFVVGPTTSNAPTATDPSADSDNMSKGYADKNYVRPVASVAAVKAIGASSRQDGQVLFVESLSAHFYFESGSSATGDDVSVITPTAGTGRWLRAKVDVNGINSGAASSGQVPTADGSGGASWSTPATAPDSPLFATNYVISPSVASSALTIALKTKAGSDATAGDPIKIAFRSSTATSGVYNVRSVTAPLFTVINSGSTAGHSNGTSHDLYVYALDNAGTVELAWSSVMWDEGTVQTTTAEGGVGGTADSNRILYSTIARTGVPIRLLARLKSNQVTAGTWAAAPTEVSTTNPFERAIAAHYNSASGQSFSSGSAAIFDYGTKVLDTHNCVTTGASWRFTCPRAGKYLVSASNQFTANSNGGARELRVAVDGSFLRTLDQRDALSGQTHVMTGSTIIDLAKDQYISIQLKQTTGVSISTVADNASNHISIAYLGV